MFRIALAFPYIDSVNTHITKGILAYARENPVFDFRFFAESDERGLRELAKWDGDGAIVALTTPKAVAMAKKLKMALVNISSECDDSSVPRVYRDHAEIGIHATNYLASLGVEEIAYLGSANAYFAEIKWSVIQKRSLELCKRASSFFMEQHPNLSEEENLTKEFCKWLKSHTAPLGLLIDNDDFYPFVYQACDRVGFRIPQDIAIISVRNSRAAQFHDVSLSSYQYNNSKHGMVTMKTLHALLENRAGEDDIDFSIQGVKLFERDSTNILHCRDPRLSSAVRQIKENSRELHSIDEIADAVGCSRRTLENAIKSELGCTLRQFLINEKLRNVKYLVDNNLYGDTFDLAVKAGFSSLRHLQSVFLKAEGHSVEDYLKKRTDGDNF
ncbi:MAG: substrate-binding domain-containing protein [Verrucomicrobiota bacterium]